MKKKVLIVTNRFVIGGPAIHIAMLGEHLQKDFEIMMVGGGASKGEVTNLDLFKNLNNEPIIINELNRKLNPFTDYIAYKKLRNHIKSFKPDIVHSHTTKPGIIARLAAKKENVSKIIHTYHGHLFKGYFPFFISKPLIIFERYLAKFTDEIITLSKTQNEEILNKYKIGNKNKNKIIPLAIDENKFLKDIDEKRKKFRNEYRISDDEIVVGIVGRLSKIKNIKFFIENLSRVKIKSSKNIRAFIIGDGPEKQELKHLSIKEGIDYAEFSYGKRKADLIFTSWCKDIEKAMAGIDILTLTSKNEGTPLSIIEAQLCSKAIVCFDVGGVKDIVKQNETAYLVDKNNYEEYINKLLDLIENDDLRVKMGKKGQEFVKANFTSKKFIENYFNLYNS